jgi:hypothetical protein
LAVILLLFFRYKSYFFDVFLSLIISSQSAIFSVIESVNTVDVHTYSPTFSVFWYLNTQMFDEFSDYFSFLYFFQPFLYSWPLTMRLKNHIMPLVC